MKRITSKLLSLLLTMAMLLSMVPMAYAKTDSSDDGTTVLNGEETTGGVYVPSEDTTPTIATQAETSSADAEVNGTEYTDLTDAITAAQKDSSKTITLLTADTETVQDILDGRYGSINELTIVLAAGEYDALTVGGVVAGANDGSIIYTCNHTDGSQPYTSNNESDYRKHVADTSVFHYTSVYTRTMNGVTLAANGDVTINGLLIESGHLHQKANPFRDGYGYYLNQTLEDFTFKGIQFVGNVDINTSSADTVISGFTFDRCSFTTNGTDSDNGQALRYYNENNNGQVSNLTVTNCTFTDCYQGVYTGHVKGVTVTGSTFKNTGHNAIAIQSNGDKGACDHGEVVITGNEFTDIGDRVIRFNYVGEGTSITITGNTATNSGKKLTDGTYEIVAATTVADGVTIDMTSTKNSWGENTVLGDGFKETTTTYVAEIGENKYETLAEAVAAAKDDDTVKLLADIALDAQIAVGKAITIDGQGQYTIKATKALVGSGKSGMFYRTTSAQGTLTFLNVTLDGNGVSKIFLNEGGAGETVFDGVTSKNGGGIAYGSGIHISGGGSHATIKDSTLTGSTGTLDLNDTNYYAANDLWVGGNVYVTVENSTIGYVFVNSAPSATPESGVVHGQLTIKGEKTKIEYLSGEEEETAIDEYGNNGSMVKIEAGEVDTIFDMGGYAISGGTFKMEIKSEWCAEGFEVKDNGDGTYGVVEAKTSAVAEINDTKYETLADAVAAANAGDTVKLLADIESADTVTISAGKDIVLDLNGKTLTCTKTATSSNAVSVASGAKLTVRDTGENGKITATASYSNAIENNGELIVNGGTFEAVYGAVFARGGSTTTINNGTFSSSSERYSVYYYANGTALTVTINGGTFEYSVSTAIESGKVTLKVNGGTFSDDLSAYCPDGYGTVLDSTTGKYVYGPLAAPSGYAEDTNGNVTISDEDGLFWFAKQVNEKGNTYSGKTVKLTSDITLTKPWTPVGVSPAKSFKGTFDGDGHKIIGLDVNGTYQGYGFGFFKTIISAKIKNVTFENADVTGIYSNIVGIVVGYSYGSSTYENVHVTNSTVYAFGKVGGIVGYAEDKNATTTFKNCSVTNSTIHGGYNTAGFCGLVQGSCDISESYLADNNVIIDENEQGFGVVTELDTTVACDGSVATCAGNGTVVKGKYIPSGKYYFSAWSDLYNHYGDSSHDCTLADGKLLANSEIVHNAPAAIGDVLYSDLLTALAAAKDGDTVTLLSDIVVEGSKGTFYNVTDGIVIDLNGHSIDGTSIGKDSADPGVLGLNVEVSGSTGVITVTNTAETKSIISGYVPLMVASYYGDPLEVVVGENVALNATGNGNGLKLKSSAYVQDTEAARAYFTNGGFLATVGSETRIYEDFATAADYADNTTATLLNDYTGGDPIQVKKYGKGNASFTLDLNNHTYTYTGGNSYGVVNLNNSKMLTVKNGTLKGTNDGQEAAVKLEESGASVVLENVTVETTGDYGIATNGSKTNNTVTLTNSTVKATNGMGVYFPSSGTLTINGGSIEAKAGGVQVCAGSLTITGNPTITVTGDPVAKTENDGAIEDGAAVSIVNRTGYKELGTITIESGTFTAKGDNAALKAYTWANNAESAWSDAGKTVNVTGGTFSAIPENMSDLCASGYVAKKNADGTYGVAEGSYVAEVGGKQYASLAEAVAAAENGQTVKLLADVTNTDYADANVININLPAGVTLDGGDHTISGNVKITVPSEGGVTIQNAIFKDIHNNAQVSDAYKTKYGFSDDKVGTLSAIYASKLAGSLTITGCQFENADWEAMQITPAEGANITIKDNVFTVTDSSTVKEQLRHIHVEMAYGTGFDYEGTDIKLTVTDNQLLGTTKEANLGVWWVGVNSTLDLTGNYFADPNAVSITLSTKECARTNSCDLIFPARSQADVDTDDLTRVAMVAADAFNSTFYTTLSDALEAAKNNETVKLLADVTEDVTIEKSITLDLGGKTLTGTAASGTATLTVAAGATATVGNGTVLGTANGHYTIQNNGTLTLEDVTATAGNTGSSMLDNWGTLTINSGVYTGGLNVVKSEEGSTLTINDGTFTLSYSKKWAYNAVILVYGDTTINGGTFIQNAKTTSSYPQVVMTGVVDGYTASTRIAGGTFKNNFSNSKAKIFWALDKATSDNFEVSGGTFNKSISDDYCAEGFIPTKNADGTYGVKEGSYVAAIGSTKYETLADAIAAAKDGDTVTLLKDVTVDTQLTISKAITLDLGGKTLTSTWAMASGAGGEARYALLLQADVTVKNGTFAAGMARAIGAYGALTLTDATVSTQLTDGNACVALCANDKTYRITDTTIDGAYALAIFANNATVNVSGGKLTGNGNVLYHNGTNYGLKLTVTGTTITSTDSCGVYISGSTEMRDAAGYQQATFTDCTITGKTAVEVKYTDLTLDNCTVTATDGNPSYVQDNNGPTAHGFAVVSTDNATNSTTPKPEGTVIIKGESGNYTGPVGLGNLASVKEKYSDLDDNTIAISGGTFSKQVEKEYCALGYEPKANDDGTYGVTEVDEEAAYVDADGKTAYGDLATALSKAKSGTTITLIKDQVTVENPYFIVAANRTLDLNGKNLTVTGKLLAFGYVIDSTDGTGLLTVTDMDSSQMPKNNPSLPIYDTSEAGYRLYSYELEQVGDGYGFDEEGALNFSFKVTFTNYEAWNKIAQDNNSVSVFYDAAWSETGKMQMLFTNASLDEHAKVAYEAKSPYYYFWMKVTGVETLKGATLRMTPKLHCAFFENALSTVSYTPTTSAES